MRIINIVVSIGSVLGPSFCLHWSCLVTWYSLTCKESGVMETQMMRKNEYIVDVLLNMEYPDFVKVTCKLKYFIRMWKK